MHGRIRSVGEAARRQEEERIADLAGRQQAVVTRAQLLSAGLSSSAIGRRLRTTRLRRLHSGVYQVGPLAGPYAPEMAAVLATGPRAVASHVSAAWVWVSPDAAERTVPRPKCAHVTTAGANRRRRRGIRLHRVVSLPGDERTARHGIPITTPARTVIDLAGMYGTREIESTVARWEREGLVGREELELLLGRYPRRAGTGVLRAILAAGEEPALTRSEAEERFLSIVRETGMDSPETNARIGHYEVDFLWSRHELAVEVDGFRDHASRSRFEGDRRKDAWLRAHGITVIRLTWRQITRERMSTGAQVAIALDRAGGADAEWGRPFLAFRTSPPAPSRTAAR